MFWMFWYNVDIITNSTCFSWAILKVFCFLMSMPAINNAQSDIPGFSWIFILKSSDSVEKGPGDGLAEVSHSFVDDGWGRYKYCLKIKRGKLSVSTSCLISSVYFLPAGLYFVFFEHFLKISLDKPAIDFSTFLSDIFCFVFWQWCDVFQTMHFYLSFVIFCWSLFTSF